MALGALDLALETLLSDEPSKVELFNDTYLNEPLESYSYKADTFAAFSIMEICGITILNLPRHFIPFTEYDNSNNDLHTYWNTFTKLCEGPLPKQIKQLYAYHERISLLDGYPNIKKYLNRALDRNSFLWNQFVAESMLEAAKKTSGPEGNIKSQMDIMILPNHSNRQQEQIVTFIKEVTNSLEEKDWSENIQTFFEINQKFLKCINWTLQKIGLLDRVD